MVRQARIDWGQVGLREPDQLISENRAELNALQGEPRPAEAEGFFKLSAAHLAKEQLLRPPETPRVACPNGANLVIETLARALGRRQVTPVALLLPTD